MKKNIMILALFSASMLSGCSDVIDEPELVAAKTCELAKEVSKDRKKWEMVATSRVRKDLVGSSGGDFMSTSGRSSFFAKVMAQADCSITSVEVLEKEQYKVSFENFYSLYVRKVNNNLKVFKVGNDGFDRF